MQINVKHLHEAARAEAVRRWDAVAKPLRSLGRFETMIAQIAAIQGTADVCLSPRCALVFCGDHGVVAQGVSQSGSDVTARVAASIVRGESNISLMARAAGAEAIAVDMGMIEPVPGTIDRRVGAGTNDLSLGPAMTRSQAEQALAAGVALVGEMKERGYMLIATGEMGIGNTTAATALACALLSADPDVWTGRGAGLSDAGLLRKRAAIRRALAVNRPDLADPVGALAMLGGFEIAGMAGAFLGGAIHGVPVVIDGAISAAAALVAARICPAAREFMLPSHLSGEAMTAAVMQALGLEPVIRGGMALGEGTGAVMLFPLLDMALSVYQGPHTFDSLGMAAYQPQEGQP